MKIIKLVNSPLKNKRFRVYLDTGKHYDFGLHNGSTFIDHKNIIKRNNYIKRHYANKTEKYLIDNLIPSPSLFSLMILWTSPNILDNVKILNDLWNN